MHRSFFGLFVLWIGVVVSGTAQAGQLPGVGPNPSWTDNQQFEWYLGYMSDATALCGDYGLSTDLAEIASLSPYGRVGMSSISGDRFGGGVCGGIRKEAKELLQKKEVYIRYMEATYDCSAGAACSDRAGPIDAVLSHACSENVKEALSDLGVDVSEVKKIEIKDLPQNGGGSFTADPNHRARIQMRSCRGSLYLDLNRACSVKQSYTRGDCEIAGVSAF